MIYLNHNVAKNGWDISADSFIKACKEFNVYSSSIDKAKLIFNLKNRCRTRTPTINKETILMKDKIAMNMEFEAMKIPHPKTFFYPFSELFHRHDNGLLYICKANKTYKALGKRIFQSLDELILWLKHHITHNEGFYIQEFEDFTREFRVVAFQDYLVHCKEKVSIKKSRIKTQDTVKYLWVDPCDLRKRLVRFVQATMRALSIDFTGADIGLTRKGEIKMIELNSAPGTGLNPARRIVKYLIRKYRLK